MFRLWNWEDTWLSVLVVIVLLVSMLMGTMFMSTKNVDYYYTSLASSTGDMGSCVYAHWTWHVDEKAFCSADKEQVLDFLARANATIKR